MLVVIQVRLCIYRPILPVFSCVYNACIYLRLQLRSSAPNDRRSHVAVSPAAVRGRHVTRKWRHCRFAARRRWWAVTGWASEVVGRRRRDLAERGLNAVGRRRTIRDDDRSKTFLTTSNNAITRRQPLCVRVPFHIQPVRIIPGTEL